MSILFFVVVARHANMLHTIAAHARFISLCIYVPHSHRQSLASFFVLQVGDKQLVVQRSSLDGAGRRADMFAGGILPVGINMEQDSEPTTVLVLLNMVTVEELADEAEYEGASCFSWFRQFWSTAVIMCLSFLLVL